MNFIKAHCGANDFIILDCRDGVSLPNNLNEFVQQITDRRTGVGGDGVVIIENSTSEGVGKQGGTPPLFRVRYFNPDGSEYEVCGNGGLCVVDYESKKEVTFSTGAGIIKGYLTNNRAKVNVVGPREVRLSLPIFTQSKAWGYQFTQPMVDMPCHFVDIGVPHTVVLVPVVNSIDINKLAPPIRFHPYFGKGGTNVNFMQIINKNEIAVRSYERGIEGETLSCGSGSCACTIVGWLTGELFSPIEVKTKGGNFRIYIDGLDNIWLEGRPQIVYEGRYMQGTLSPVTPTPRQRWGKN